MQPPERGDVYIMLCHAQKIGASLSNDTLSEKNLGTERLNKGIECTKVESFPKKNLSTELCEGIE
jgi:hypothetical protein